jgi:hypothetical protein
MRNFRPTIWLLFLANLTLRGVMFLSRLAWALGVRVRDLMTGAARDPARNLLTVQSGTKPAENPIAPFCFQRRH